MYLLKPLHDFLEGGLQLLGHCPFHGCQLGQRAVLLHARKHCVTYSNYGDQLDVH